MKLQGGKYIKHNQSEKAPLFSIITVVFNGEKHLERTIKSIINQTYTNFEYLIIDGNSTDKTLEIIKKYEDSIDFWQSEPDKGLYDAMNKALKLAKGDYICFINTGDELYSSNILADLAEIVRDKDAVYSDTIVIDEAGREVGKLSELSHNKAPDNLTWKSFGKGMAVCHQSFVARRIKAPFFNTAYRFSSDIDWIIRFLINNPEVIKYQGFIAKFMVGGLSQSHLNRGMKERYKVLKQHFGFWANLFNHIQMIPRVLFRWLFKRKKTNF